MMLKSHVRCAALAAALLIGGAAAAKDLPGAQGSGAQNDVMEALYAAAADGSGDAQLPYVLDALSAAVENQDLIGFLDLVDPGYFAQQFNFLHGGSRPPGETLSQFSCEFMMICTVAHRYRFNDIVAMEVLDTGSQGGGGLVEVFVRFEMRDGATVEGSFFYSPSTQRLLSGVG